jgi:hypothetical protein
MSESFSTLPLQTQINAYCYLQYSDDENIQAFFSSFNTLAQSYLDWFNETPLAIYTSSSISGLLLDWVGQGIYGIARPVLSKFSSSVTAGYNSAAYNTLAYNALDFSASGTAEIATDDIYKRILTWHLYKGDGQQFSIQWLKNRVARFLYGVNGGDWPVLDNPPSVAVSGGAFTITVPASDGATSLQQCMNNGILALPFQNTFTVVT